MAGLKIFAVLVGFTSALTLSWGSAYADSKFTTEADNLGNREKLGFYHGIASGEPITMGANAGVGQSSVLDAAQTASSVINEKAEDVERVAQQNLDAMKRATNLKISALERRLASAPTSGAGTVSETTRMGYTTELGPYQCIKRHFKGGCDQRGNPQYAYACRETATLLDGHVTGKTFQRLGRINRASGPRFSGC